jgi:hypothetical protein
MKFTAFCYTRSLIDNYGNRYDDMLARLNLSTAQCRQRFLDTLFFVIAFKNKLQLLIHF